MLLSTGQLDAAAKHLDAALEVDPASLAALTLRERLNALRASGGRAAADQRPTTANDLRANAHVSAPATTDLSPSTAGRFVPSGVDAASWTDFEQRVQQRRFRALIDAGNRAVGAGDLAGARAALEEARELQPESLEVSRLSIHLATIPMIAANTAEREGLFRSRTFRAASLLLLGVSLLMGLDWVRSDQAVPHTSKPGPIGTGGQDAEQITAVNEEAAPAPVSTVEAPNEVEATLPTPEVPVAVPQVARGRDLPGAPGSVPVASPTASPRRELAPGEVPDDYVGGAFQPAPREVVFSPSPSGEVPDGYVAPSRREVVTLASSVRAANTSPVESVTRQPSGVVDTLATSPGAATSPIVAPAPIAPAAAAGAAAVVIPNEKARVESVLHQYARAYGQLDARAVRAVYPSVNERALADAFSDLSSQSVSFDTCTINVEGVSAKASCQGTASYIRKVGNRDQRTEPRRVRFELKRDGDAWRIQKAETGR